MDHQQRVVIMAIQQHVQRFEVMLATGVIAEIQWVSDIHGFRQRLAEKSAGLFAESGKFAVAQPKLIQRQRSRRCAVTDNHDFLAAQWAHMAEGFHRREQFVSILNPQQTRALNSGVPGRIHTGIDVQQLLRRRTTPAFDHQDRLIARRATGRGDKATGVAKVFKIEQNSAGFTVASKEIEQVINVDIQAIAERDKVRKPHFALLGPVEDGVGYGRRLRNKRQFTAMDRNRRKAGVKALPGRKQAETIRPEQAHLIAGCAFKQRGILFG